MCRILLSCILLFGWSTIGHGRSRVAPYPVIDPLLAPYIEEFAREARKRGVHVNTDVLGVAVFSTLPGGIAGFCNGAGAYWERQVIRRSAVLIISREYFDRAGDPNDYTFKALVFHELGHCLLHRGHDPEEYLTIMTSFPIGALEMPYWEMSYRYKATWQAQLNDLFLRPEGALPGQEFLINDLLENSFLLPFIITPRISAPRLIP